MHEIELVEYYSKYLIDHGVEFQQNGFPKFKEEWFINTFPKVITPFSKRHYFIENKSDVTICYFEKDEYLYPRLDKVFKEISILKQYHSICMMDISVSPLMLDEVQRMNLLINLLYTCVVAVNGVKIIPSLRTGNFETLQLLSSSLGNPKIWVMGSVGTQRTKENAYYAFLFRTKCLYLFPKTILCYGKPNKNTIKLLCEYGSDLKVYKDFRSLSYGLEIDYGRL